ncbi:hypothetical protein HMPREF1985_01001 [Mitsuokella sp. oral taxon 131 str. W9106]|nr:hypothetical protein HMPREF1985_01001 [Mitsuokella sp. oral taxon 131 str. W9106]
MDVLVHLPVCSEDGRFSCCRHPFDPMRQWDGSSFVVRQWRWRCERLLKIVYEGGLWYN